jgi:hypothetical protein
MAFSLTPLKSRGAAPLVVPAACDTINSYGAQTFKEPTT